MRNIFFIVIPLFFLGINFYVFYRIYCLLPASWLSTLAVVIVALLLNAAFFGSLIWGGSLPTALTAVAYRVGTAFFFVFLYVLLIFLVADIVRFTHLTHIEHFMTHSWAGAGILIFIVSTIFIYGNINYHNKKRTEINIEIEKPLGENGKLKMLLISDLHLGYGIGRAELDKWVKLLNAENADVILVAGDVIDRFARPLEEEQMYKSLNDLKARYGVFMALGNHDFLGNIAENLAFLQKTNFTLLRDTAVLVDSSFYIAGRNDYSQSARLPLAAILQNADATKPLFLIDHQPNNLNDAEQNGIDLQVSGHTHYGQIFPINLIEKLIFEKPYGYLKKNDTHYFISSGLGIWGGKFRIGSRSEYVVINIVGL